MKKIVRTAALVFLVGSAGYYLWYGLGDRGRSNYGIDALSWVGPQMIWPIVAVSVVVVCFALTGDSVLAAFTGRNSAAFRQGAVGIGTVRSVRQTGMTLNDQPEVRIDLGVEGADGETFESHARMIVPLTELALLRPGVVLPVRYLPDRTDKVEIDRSGDMSTAQDALNRSMIREGITTPGKLDIAARGIPAPAVVQSLSVPGEIRNGNSKVELGPGGDGPLSAGARAGGRHRPSCECVTTAISPGAEVPVTGRGAGVVRAAAPRRRRRR